MRNIFDREEQSFRAKLTYALYRSDRSDPSDRTDRTSISARATLRPAFSLVEVIIVAVVLTVLLATVWSLFAMQQRTLERGQRLSRDTRVSLALQRLLHDDLSRTAMRLSSPKAEENSSGSSPFVPSQSNEGLGGSTSDDAGESSVPAQFLFAGGSDWLIVDVLRPAYQMGAFEDSTDESGAASLGDAASGLPAATNLADNNPDELPQREPTPFERVIYLWLTEDEIQEVTGLLYGHEQTPESSPRGNAFSASQSAPPNNSPTTTDRQDDFSLVDTDMTQLRLPRTLLRIRTDWSWPRETEVTGTTWENAVSSGEDDGLDFSSGLDPFSGSTTPQRRQWLRRLLWQSRNPYREFHVQAESAINLNDAASVNNQPAARDEFSDLTDMVSAEDQASRHLLPNQWEPQVDWFPEVVAGKFQFFDGTTWQDSFSERPDTKLPLAVRLQYEVDARRYPVQVDMAALEAGLSNSQDLLSQDPRTTGPLNSEVDDPLLSDLAASRPEFPRVAVYTFRSQASRRDRTLEFDSEVDLEDDADRDDPFGEANATTELFGAAASDFENPANQGRGSNRGGGF